MYKKIIKILIFVTGIINFSDGYDFGGYRYYEITDNAGIPVVKAYSQKGLTFTLPIDPESKLTEYVMARLINMHHDADEIAYEPTEKMYLFKYGYKAHRWCNEFCDKGIGLYEEEPSKDIVLKVFLDGFSQPPVTFRLSPGDSAEKKMKFEYLIASIVDYYSFLGDGGDDNIGIERVFEDPGDPTSDVIGLRFEIKN